MKLIQQTKLYFQEGNSDKVYEIDLCELSPEEYLVNFRYGRRGKSLKEGTKTSAAVSREKAGKIFSDLENEKRKKGYQSETEISIELPSLEAVNPNTKEGIILQRLHDAATGRNSFKTEWKTSRVIWKAGELNIQEAIPFIIKLATKGDDMQMYSAFVTLIRLKAEQAEPLFQAYAFQSKREAYIRNAACEGLLALLKGEERVEFGKKLYTKLPSDIQASIASSDFDTLSNKLHQYSEKRAADFFTNFYLYCSIRPELLPCLHKEIREWHYETPFFRHIRAIYKLSQIRKDYLTMAILAYRFEKEQAMFRFSSNTQLAFSQATKNYFQKNSAGFLQQTGQSNDAKKYLQLAVSILLQYSEKDYKPACELPANRYGEYDRSKKLYSYILNNCPECYDSFLLSIILFGNDPERKKETNFTYISGQRTVYSRSYYYQENNIIRESGNTGPRNESVSGGGITGFLKKILSREKKVQEIEETVQEVPEEETRSQPTCRFELYPDYWDTMPEAYVQLLMQARMNVIHRFAYQNLTVHPRFEEISQRFDEKTLLQLLYSEFNYPGKLAFDFLQEGKNTFLDEPEFIGKVLDCNYPDARKWAQAKTDCNLKYYLDNTEFLFLLISNTRPENQSWIDDLLRNQRFTEEKQQALLGKVVAALLLLEDNDRNNQWAQAIIKRIELVASVQLNRISWDILEQLIVSPLLSNISLASTITLQKAQRSDITSIPLLLIELFLKNSLPEVRENGIQMFRQYPENSLLSNIGMVLNMTGNPYQEVVTVGLDSIRKLISYRESAGNTAVRHFAYSLMRKESFEGAHTPLKEFFLKELKPYHNSGLTAKDITKLVHSSYRTGQLAGYEVLQGYDKANELSIGQIISFGNHELLAIRQWCWNYFKQNVSRIRYEKDKALDILDSSWDDTRTFAFQFFKTEFTESDWDADTLVSITDSIRPDVESFGKELITRYFNPENAICYLSKLSEHPSVNVQAFVTSYLAMYATGNKEIIGELGYFFRSVLTRVNKARVAKDRILKFLHQEALKDAEIAALIVPILDDLSAQSTIQDKESCIHILKEIKELYPNLEMHLTIKNQNV